MLDMLTNSVVQLLMPIIIAVLGFFGAAVYGRKKEREGHKKGREEELARSKAKVEQVETEMKAEIEKPRTTKETKKRLEGGNF